MRACLVFLLCAAALPGQLAQLTREEMVRLTASNPFERFPDGRPKAPDALLEKLRSLSVDDVYEFLRGKGYPNQFAGGFEILRPGVKLVGRAFTAQYLPLRPDLAEAIEVVAKQRGLPRSTNQKVIDQLQPGDVPVVDVMGAAPGNNFGGDNLHAAIFGATRRGAIIDGTIRDLEGMHDFPTQLYFRMAHPAPVNNVVVAGLNVPIRIGRAAVLPGDVVLGDRTGVIFIPPHLLAEALKIAK